jgi:Flp pilus assembly protein TadD
MGEIFAQLQRNDEARQAYVAAREADPKSFEATAGIARSYQIAQDYAEAAKLLREMTGMRPESSAIRVQLALCLMRMERKEDAKAECRAALQLNPSDRRAADLLKELEHP